MPGRMGEVPRQFPLPEDTTRRAIDFGGSYARTTPRDRPPLRLQHRLVQPSSFSRRPSDMHRTRAIRTITGEYNTKIADYEPPAGDARVGGPAVHNRRALSGSQYRRERHAFGPGATGLVFHGGGDFDLAHARPNLLACDAEQTGAEFHRSPDAQNLVRILRHAGALDQRWRGTPARLPVQRRRLGAVAAGRKQDGTRIDGTRIADQQSCGTPSKAAQIVNIRKVSQQQQVQVVLFEPRSKTAQAASVIHSRSVARSSCQLPVASCQRWRLTVLPLATGNGTSKAKPPDSRQVLRESRRLGLF